MALAMQAAMLLMEGLPGLDMKVGALCHYNTPLTSLLGGHLTMKTESHFQPPILCLSVFCLSLTRLTSKFLHHLHH